MEYPYCNMNKISPLYRMFYNKKNRNKIYENEKEANQRENWCLYNPTPSHSVQKSNRRMAVNQMAHVWFIRFTNHLRINLVQLCLYRLNGCTRSSWMGYLRRGIYIHNAVIVSKRYIYKLSQSNRYIRFQMRITVSEELQVDVMLSWNIISFCNLLNFIVSFAMLLS